MTKELERAGLPTALVSAMVPLAASVGPNRIVAGTAVTHPVGNPALTREQEKEVRRHIVRSALDALETDVKEQLVIPLDPS